MNFIEKLENSWKISKSLLQVGLDPNPTLFPEEFRNQSNSIFEFCRCIVDATAFYVCSFKLQIAYFSAYKAEDQLEELCSYIRNNYPNLLIVLDSKRGDIYSTSKNYAYEAYERYQAHAVTVNPYMGFDSIEPYLEWNDRGIIVLCLTSNSGSSDFQFLNLSNGEPLYLYIAGLIADKWNKNSQFGLVVGANHTNELFKIRKRIGNAMPLLIPGIGFQGGNIKDTVDAGINIDGNGIMINSSRKIIYASSNNNWMEAAAESARDYCNEINNARCEKIF
ncbi:MAG: orotidine-5'-phosphate decarboxylase [Bordetella sp.]|nr:MAG: orotidine-5'-phosphate decarboxylase [Bordetella sp.]